MRLPWNKNRGTPPTDSGLEQKIKTAVLVKRVKVVERFVDSEYAAKTIWDYFFSQGKIIRIGESTSFSLTGETLKGAPQMQRSDDGALYPLLAVFEAEINKSSYVIKLGGSKEELNVEIECDVEDLLPIERLLVSSHNDLVSIVKDYDHDVQPLGRLYQIIAREATSLQVLPSTKYQHRTPVMVHDEEFGLFPTHARVVAVMDKIKYVFHFSSDYNTGMKVDCPREQAEKIGNLLDKVRNPKLDEGETRVQSLDFSVSVKEYNWGMVGGLGQVQQELIQYLQWPLENVILFESVDLEIPKGIIITGPPGNAKTTIAKIIANETNSSFYTVSPKDINSMWVGKIEQNWGRLFGMARADVQKGKRAIIFIDEIDGFFTNRDKMEREYQRAAFSQFCQEMDGISDLQGVVVLAATNKYQLLDEALIRPGRFTKRIYIDNPNEEGRKEILAIYTKKKPVENIDLKKLAKDTEGFSGAELKELCGMATYNALERYSRTKRIDIKDIKMDLIKEVKVGQLDFQSALKSATEYHLQRSKEEK
ncbi:MAG: ATP-binding protein [Nanoarchaeota archaeon]|nr:ATP-binding protein [Nanoarchaeota archaeon]